MGKKDPEACWRTMRLPFAPEYAWISGFCTGGRPTRTPAAHDVVVSVAVEVAGVAEADAEVGVHWRVSDRADLKSPSLRSRHVRGPGSPPTETSDGEAIA